MYGEKVLQSGAHKANKTERANYDSINNIVNWVRCTPFSH